MNLFPNLDDFFITEVQNGIFLRYADIVFSKYFIYVVTPQNNLYPCVIYQAVLSARDYATKGKPLVHFCNCKVLWGIYDKHYNNLKVKIPRDNSFDFKADVVRGNATKEFYGVDLPLCPQCIELYEKIFLKFNFKQNMEFWNLLFANKRILSLEKIALEDSISINQRFSQMSVSVCDKSFHLDYNRDYSWLY